MTLLRLFLLLPTIALFAVGCNNTAKDDVAQNPTAEDADSMALNCYRMQMNGQFDEFVANIHSCDGTPHDYKQRYIYMLRQHQKQIIKEKGGITDIEVIRTEMHHNNCMANVFLKIGYKDGSYEEIIYPMIFNKNHWRMQ